ncbi:MAG: hypothetical protein GY913_28930 [Proteobacteria bacterium]|nr:hypothetical protein [Pseudomonadota bacterium]
MTCLDGDLPATVSSTTNGGSRDFDSYSCASSTDESGPEEIFRVKLDERGFLAADFREMGSGADIDLHILSDLSEDACINRGHQAAGATLEPGYYYVVADTWVSSGGAEQKGSYTMQVGVVTVDDLASEGMSESVADLYLTALSNVWAEGHTQHMVHGAIDYELYSAVERFWIWDFPAEEPLWTLHVTHGENSAKNTDLGWAVRFSNVNESHKSSLGMFLTAEDYYGSWDHSLRYDGLESGYNDLVRSRAIVLHGADWARPEMVDEYGMLGLSWGCTTVDDRIISDVIADLMGGYVWNYYDDGDWSVNSDYL